MIRGGEMRSVLITGTSSGIGFDAVREFIEGEFFVYGSVRTKQDAVRLKEEFPDKQFMPLIFDICDGQAIKRAAETISERLQGEGLAGLVNNAGVAVGGPILHIPVEELRHQFDVNVLGMVRVTQAFAPLLGAGRGTGIKPGRIVNISSVSGRLAFPFLGPYAASKHAVEALSDVMRRELMPYGIDVITIEPGNTDTPIWAKAQETQPYEETEYVEILANLKRSILDVSALQSLPVARVSSLIFHAMTTKRPKTRYVILKERLLGWFLPRLLSDRVLDKLIAAKLNLSKEGLVSRK